ncbi:hypothetical protein HK102_004936 [Quaeritorhiza haematococci]|nr:hypothetical protein HK102_004936 [Quaeritorhiza haematococci]
MVNNMAKFNKQKLTITKPAWFDHDIFSPTVAHKQRWTERGSIKILGWGAFCNIISIATTITSLVLTFTDSNSNLWQCQPNTTSTTETAGIGLSFIGSQTCTMAKVGTGLLIFHANLSLVVLGLNVFAIAYLVRNMWSWGLGSLRLALTFLAMSVIHRVMGFFLIIASTRPTTGSQDGLETSALLHIFGLLTDVAFLGLALKANYKVFDERFGGPTLRSPGPYRTFDDADSEVKDRLISQPVTIEKPIVIFEIPSTPKMTAVAPWHKLYRPAAERKSGAQPLEPAASSDGQ